MTDRPMRSVNQTWWVVSNYGIVISGSLHLTRKAAKAWAEDNYANWAQGALEFRKVKLVEQA